MDAMKSETSTWSLRELAAAAIAVGMFVGAVFASADLMMNRANASTAKSAQLIVAMSLLIGSCAMPAITLFVGIARRIPAMPTEPALLAFCLGVGVQIAFLFTLSLRGLEVLAFVPWLIALGAYRLFQRAHSRGILTRAVVLCLCAAVFVPLLMSLGGLRGGKLRTLITLLMVIAPALYLQSVAIRFRVPVFAALVVALVTMQWTGTQSRAWLEQPVTTTGLETSAAAQGTEQLDGSATDGARPNVVLIVLDTTRADRLGCYGHGGKLTPRLDAFASESVLYEDAISSAPWTVPSHASLFTGWYSVTHGCDNEPHRWLDSGFVTLAEMLHAQGYDTVEMACNGYLLETNLLQGYEAQLDLGLASGHRATKMYDWMAKAGAPSAWSDQGAYESSTELMQWLSQRKEKQKPFHLFVNLMEAHWPLRPPYQQRKEQLMPGMGYWEATRVGARFYGPKWTAGERRTQRDEEAVRRLYNAEIAYQDSRLGSLLEVLRAQTNFDNTLVIITADHGEHHGEHGNWDHVFSLGEALIHVPLIIRFPARFPPGKRVSGQCQLVDIVPTVFDVLDIPCPVKGLPGRTLVPDLFQPREYTYSEVHPYFAHLERLAEVTGFRRDIAQFLDYLRCVRTDQYKFVWSDRGRRHLYDIKADPAEAHDLVNDLPEIAAQLEAHMHDWWKAQPPYESREAAESAPTSEATLRGLRGLGYVK